MSRTFAFAIFSHFDATTTRFIEIKVPVSEIEAYHAKTQEWVQRVIWNDNSVSWAKSFIGANYLRDGSINPNAGKVVKIGAGAYGDSVVWERV